MRKLASIALLTAGALAAGCSDNTSSNNVATPAKDTLRTVVGSSQPIGGGSVQSWMIVDTANIPSSMGVTFSDKALVGLPVDTLFHMYPLTLPSVKSMTPFDHVELDWNPHGHPPPGVYDQPHFDFHFYTIDSATQMGIMPGPDMAPMDTTLLPPYYATDHQAVPMMGVHYSPFTDFVKGFQFQHTLIYGTTQGHFAFVEPMITKAFIEGSTNDTLDIPQPTKYAFPGKYFPTKYVVSSNTTAKTYTIALTGFVKR